MCSDITTSTDAGKSYANVTFASQNLTDNDGKTPSLMSNVSGNSFNIGSTVVMLTAQDGAGNENFCVFTVTVQGMIENVRITWYCCNKFLSLEMKRMLNFIKLRDEGFGLK